MCLDVYVLESRTLVERGRRGAESPCLPACQSGVHLSALKLPLTWFNALPAFLCSLQTLLRVFAVVFCSPPFPCYPGCRHWPQPRSRSSPRVLLHSSPPSFTCRWAEEQYPGGHGDRQPPPCGPFLLLFLLLLLLGSCTLLSRHAGQVPTAWLGLQSWENRTLKFMHHSGEPWEMCVREFKLMFMTGFLY